MKGKPEKEEGEKLIFFVDFDSNLEQKKRGENAGPDQGGQSAHAAFTFASDTTHAPLRE
jgi:hypothetical protein